MTRPHGLTVISFSPDMAANMCSRGHPRIPENIYNAPNGSRLCARCRAENVRRFRERRGLFYGVRDERSFEERFWERVDRQDTDDCWLWTGCRSHFGHGLVWRDGRHHSAHRIAWESANNEELGERWALHSCDNPPCCNPRHLRPGNALDNSGDATDRKRFPSQQRTHCKRGHEFTADNIYWLFNKSSRRKVRTCRECQRIAVRAWSKRQKNRST
jgi:hypothetical protein